MKIYMIYSQKTIWITENFENKDSGYSIKFESIPDMIMEIRNNRDEYRNFKFYEECGDSNGNTFYEEATVNDI